MDPLEVGAVHQAMPQGTIEHKAQTSEEVQLATDRPQTNDRCKAHMRLGEKVPGTGDMRAKEETIPAIRTEGRFQVQNPYQGGNDTQAGHSRDATSMATAFEPLNRCLETFLTRLS